MIQITDHFLDLGSFMLLKDLLLGYQKHENHSSLPWTLGRVLSDKFYSGDNEDKHVDYNFHFCHTFYKNNGNESHTSQNINIIKPLIDKLVHIKNARSFRRIKVNLNIKSPSIILS